MDPLTIRASALSDFPDCDRRGAVKSFRRLVEMMGYTLRTTVSHVGAAIGTGVHHAAKVMLDEKAKTGALPPESVATDAAIEALRERAAEGVAYDRDTTSLNAAEQQARRMTQAYRIGIAPKVNPLVVEQRFEAAVPWTKYPIILSGQSDVIAREPQRIRDLKTGKRSHHRPQLGAYALLARTCDLDVTKTTEDFIPRVALTKPQPPAQTFDHDLDGCEQAAVAVIKHIDAQLDVFLNGDEARRIQVGDAWAFVANPKSKLCSAKFCPAHGTEFCREWQQGEEEEPPPETMPDLPAPAMVAAKPPRNPFLTGDWR